MMASSSGSKLRALIDAFLKGGVSFEVLETQFSSTYLESADLEDDEVELYAPIHEKIEYTVPAPPAADRNWYLDHREFAEWLREYWARGEAPGTGAWTR